MTIELLESYIKIMNDDAFHRMGDNYLFYDFGEEFESINPIGQVEGKQKSKGGTPDTTITLSNGLKVLIQYTTQEGTKNRAGFNNKLISDLQACLDEKKTAVPLAEISEIILCYNSNSDAKTEKAIAAIGYDAGIRIRLINLTTMAHNIYRFYPFLAKEYFKLELDTYQLLPLDGFIAEYEKVGFATPLRNPFFHRKSELEEIVSSIENNTVTVVIGKAGVGKSRLVIEAIREFSKKKNSTSLCIRNKDMPIIYDLRKYISKNDEYLLFIDDANKSISHLRELFNFRSESEKKLKIVVTLRDYVFAQVQPLLGEFGFNSISIQPFTREELKDMISAEPFNIKHPSFSKRVLEVSHGNARMAIMTAIAAKKANLKELGNLSMIYERYFLQIASENKELLEGDNLKVLGILSFLKVYDHDDPARGRTILHIFQMSENDFWTRIYNLEKSEFVNVFTDRKTARISDQLLEGYSFYRCFFVDRVLDYQLVLDVLYPQFAKQIKSTAIEANNTFGFENFGKLIIPFITERYYKGWDSEKDKLRFLAIFWFYLQEETLYYIKESMDKLPSAVFGIRDATRKVGQHRHIVIDPDMELDAEEQDETIDILDDFLRNHNNNSKLAIELVFEYMKKKPMVSEKVAMSIKGGYNFDYQDRDHYYLRHEVFIDTLHSRIAGGDTHLDYLFLRLCPHFLKTHFTSGSRYKNTMQLQNIDIGIEDSIKKIRGQLWHLLDGYFEKYPILCLAVFKKVLDSIWMDYSQDVNRFDRPFIEGILLKNMDFENMEHVILVNGFVSKLLKRQQTGGKLSKLKALSATREYKWYRAMDWNLHRNKERYERKDESYDSFRKRFEKLKTEELQETFDFKSLHEFGDFLSFAENCLVAAPYDHHHFRRSTLIIFKVFYANSPNEFLNFLKSVFNSRNIDKLLYFGELVAFFDREHPYELPKIEHLIQNSQNPVDLSVDFYNNLSETFVTKERASRFAESILLFKGRFSLNFDKIREYSRYIPGFAERQLKRLLEKEWSGECTIIPGRDFILENYCELKKYPGLAGQLYICFDSELGIYDFDGKEFRFLIENDDEFLGFYTNFLLTDKKTRHQGNRHLQSLWNGGDYIRSITQVFDSLFGFLYFSWEMEEVVKDLFERGPQEKKNALFTYLIEQYHKDIKKMDLCVKMISSKFQDHREELFLKLLMLNSDIHFFQDISWTDRGVIVHGGDYIAADHDRMVWKNMIGILDQCEPKAAYLAHIVYCNRQIEFANRSSVHERKQNFIDPC